MKNTLYIYDATLIPNWAEDLSSLMTVDMEDMGRLHLILPARKHCTVVSDQLCSIVNSEKLKLDSVSVVDKKEGAVEVGKYFNSMLNNDYDRIVVVTASDAVEGAIKLLTSISDLHDTHVGVVKAVVQVATGNVVRRSFTFRCDKSGYIL